MIDPTLSRTLGRVADLLTDATAPWWVIGSAAVALHGAPVAVTRDVDVLVDAADMPMFAAKTGVAPTPGVADERFRSARVLRLTDGPLAIELFADFEVCGADGVWERLWPMTRMLIGDQHVALPVPTANELIAILIRFGRPKDLARAALLRAERMP